MIFDSSGWRADLRRRAQAVGRRIHQKRWVPRSFDLLEQDLFMCAFMARKLNEAAKVPDTTWLLDVPARVYKRTNRRITRLNWHHIDDMYHLDHGPLTTVKVDKLCNMLIHSYVFVIDYSKRDGFRGILTNSDRTKSKGLWHFSALHLAQLFARIAMDDVVAGTFSLESTDLTADLDYKYTLRGLWDFPSEEGVDAWKWLGDVPTWD